jgi:hypothetical protein
VRKQYFRKVRGLALGKKWLHWDLKSVLSAASFVGYFVWFFPIKSYCFAEKQRIIPELNHPVVLDIFMVKMSERY